MTEKARSGTSDNRRLGALEVPETTPDGLPLFVPVERTDTLVRCQLCGAVVEGDTVGQTQHHFWHEHLDARVRRAWMPPRYA